MRLRSSRFSVLFRRIERLGGKKHKELYLILSSKNTSLMSIYDSEHKELSIHTT